MGFVQYWSQCPHGRLFDRIISFRFNLHGFSNISNFDRFSESSDNFILKDEKFNELIYCSLLSFIDLEAKLGNLVATFG